MGESGAVRPGLRGVLAIESDDAERRRVRRESPSLSRGPDHGMQGLSELQTTQGTSRAGCLRAPPKGPAM